MTQMSSSRRDAPDRKYARLPPSAMTCDNPGLILQHVLFDEVGTV